MFCDDGEQNRNPNQKLLENTNNQNQNWLENQNHSLSFEGTHILQNPRVPQIFTLVLQIWKVQNISSSVLQMATQHLETFYFNWMNRIYFSPLSIYNIQY